MIFVCTGITMSSDTECEVVLTEHSVTLPYRPGRDAHVLRLQGQPPHVFRVGCRYNVTVSAHDG